MVCKGQIALALGVLLALSGPYTSARAEWPPPIEHGEVVMRGMALEVAALGRQGVSEFAPVVGDFSLGVNSYGVVLRDRHGVVARSMAALLIALGAALQSSGPKSIESRSYRQGNYRITETTTHYYSEAEKRQIRENASAAAAGLFELSASETEIEVYSRDRWGLGDSSGYKINFLLGDQLTDFMDFTVGFGWGDVDSLVEKDGVTYQLDHKYLGMPFRLSVATPIFMMQLTYEWNWLAHSDDIQEVPVDNGDGTMYAEVAHHPWHFDLTGAIFGRLVGSVGVTVPTLSEWKEVGIRASAGLRF